MARNLKSELWRKYPPPSNDKETIRDWKMLLPEISAREEFKPSDTLLLESLCAMYKQKRSIEATILDSGITENTQFGTKLKPEIQLLNKLRSEIRLYHRALGIGNSPVFGGLNNEDDEKEWR